MTLKNLLGISLDAVPADKGLVVKLLAAAQRNIADAQLPGLSAENRFDTAYKAIMQLAMLALNANGYRTLTSKPGHHQTAIQTLPLSVGLAPAKVIVLEPAQTTQPVGLLWRPDPGRRRRRMPGQRTRAAGPCPRLAAGPSNCSRRSATACRHVKSLGVSALRCTMEK